MTIRTLFLLLPIVLSGGILVHLIWPDQGFKSILLKIFLGIGIGLGLNSLLYFIYLSVSKRQVGFIVFQILELVILISILLYRGKVYRVSLQGLKVPWRTNLFILIITGTMVVLALVIYKNVSLGKPQGAWDSWMIYNRAARFFHRGGTHWTDAFSPDLYWYFHADYPPMLALNIASIWDTLGEETVRVPMLIGGAFLFGSAGLMFAGMNAYKTASQASLAMIVLFGISAFIEQGSKQVADVPLSFFILATGVLIFLYTLKSRRELLILAGLSVGLAAWTKNEGVVFMLISLLALGVAYWNKLKQVFPWYLLGLAVPLSILIYFKVFLAPPGDLFTDIPNQMAQIGDADRHRELLNQMGIDLMSLLNWKLLLVYALILGVEKPGKNLPAYLAILIAILLQLAGYYSIFIISPHVLAWHISALYRLLLQIGPLIVFFYFCVVRPPETIFQTK